MIEKGIILRGGDWNLDEGLVIEDCSTSKSKLLKWAPQTSSVSTLSQANEAETTTNATTIPTIIRLLLEAVIIQRLINSSTHLSNN